jgi:hypothetical protein
MKLSFETKIKVICYVFYIYIYIYIYPLFEIQFTPKFYDSAKENKHLPRTSRRCFFKIKGCVLIMNIFHKSAQRIFTKYVESTNIVYCFLGRNISIV